MEGKELALLREISRLYHDKATGELSVRGEGFEKRVYFEEGRIIFAASNIEQDRLGNLLVEAEKIMPEQLHEAEKLIGTGTKLGTVLVWKGFLSPEDLYWGIKFQATRIIYSLFQLESFEYGFRQRELGRDEVLRLNFQTPNIIMEGARRMGSAPLLRQALPPNCFVRITPEDDRTKAIDFLPKEKELLPLLNGKYTIRKLIGLRLMDELELLRMLHGLLTLRKLGVSGDTIGIAVEAPAAPAPEPAPPEPESPPSVPAQRPEAFVHAEYDRVDELDRRQAHVRNLRLIAAAACAVGIVVGGIYLYRALTVRPVPSERPVEQPPSGAQTAPSQAPKENPAAVPPSEDSVPTSVVTPHPAPAEQSSLILLQEPRAEVMADGRYRIQFRLANGGTPGSEQRGYLFMLAVSSAGTAQVVYPSGVGVSDVRIQYGRGEPFKVSRFKMVDAAVRVPFEPVAIRVMAFGRDGAEHLNAEIPLVSP